MQMNWLFGLLEHLCVGSFGSVKMSFDILFFVYKISLKNCRLGFFFNYNFFFCFVANECIAGKNRCFKKVLFQVICVFVLYVSFSSVLEYLI